jgi:hypothetical protein
VMNSRRLISFPEPRPRWARENISQFSWVVRQVTLNCITTQCLLWVRTSTAT